jgi:hypothetical protein
MEPTDGPGGRALPDMPELTDDACERLVRTCMRAYFRAEWGISVEPEEAEEGDEAWDDENDLEAVEVEREMEEPSGWED